MMSTMMKVEEDLAFMISTAKNIQLEMEKVKLWVNDQSIRKRLTLKN